MEQLEQSPPPKKPDTSWRVVTDDTQLPIWATRRALREANVASFGSGYPDIAYGSRQVLVVRVIDGKTQYGITNADIDESGKDTGQLGQSISEIIQMPNGKPDLGSILDKQVVNW